MDKIAVIKTGGKQYLVKQGQSIKIEKIIGEANKAVKFDTLLIANDKKLDLGKPSLGNQVEGKIIEQGRNKKIPQVAVFVYLTPTRLSKNVSNSHIFVGA